MSEKKEVFGWTMFILMITIIVIIIMAIISYTLFFTRTLVERKVFEESYQYKSGIRDSIAIYRAQLAEINSRLSDTSLDPNTRKSLEAQKARIQVLLGAKTQDQ